ncbi:hypothetical protein ABZ916_20115 [Streptomyces sp. NPDC046853]|uniref:hypothetical protein n=1 Tax=Streptomyces sp. NPDC046853 TaxID=3154920 RepID=UPI0033DBC26C
MTISRQIPTPAMPDLGRITMPRHDLVAVIARFVAQLIGHVRSDYRHDVESRRDAHLNRLVVGSKAAEVDHQSRRKTR